jgi:HPt (histidine-containing phosphotransfer) domain-containing protein
MKGFEREIEAAGFTGYLTKPVDIDAMLAELARHLDGRRVEAPGHDVAGAATPPAPPAAGAAPIESRLARHPRLRHVVRSFGLQLPARLRAMQAALASDDLAELAQLAHWLKGAGGTVGYDAFFEPAVALEERARSGDRGAIAESLQQLQALAGRIVVPDEEVALAP